MHVNCALYREQLCEAGTCTHAWLINTDIERKRTILHFRPPPHFGCNEQTKRHLNDLNMSDLVLWVQGWMKWIHWTHNSMCNELLLRIEFIQCPVRNHRSFWMGEEANHTASLRKARAVCNPEQSSHTSGVEKNKGACVCAWTDLRIGADVKKWSENTNKN